MAPHVRLYKDGTVFRQNTLPLLPASPEPGEDGVASKDITLDADRGLWARVFLPSSPSASDLTHKKLPVILYFHGGGFIFGSPDWSGSHMFCAGVAKRSESIIVSASYRLAPEHRLPAAFEDGFSALKWLHSQSLHQSEGKHELMDSWLVSADFSRCFIGGGSAGATIAYHLGKTAFNTPYSAASWTPMCITGLVLVHPGFVRGSRTQEELDCYQDKHMNWNMVEVCSKIILPRGSGMDNSYLNPLPIASSPGSPFTLPKSLVLLAENDALRFYILECVEALKHAGCDIDTVMQHGVGHVFFIDQPDSLQARHMLHTIADFINEDHKIL
ncbi:hypothetical protein KP509_14G006300 [Ceratopteris richardii]|nr:hypothetical protein KP509_14G006300 [Ceratopteris richardii]